MKSRIALFLLGLVGIAPIAVTAACGGKVTATDNVDPGSASPSGPGATSTSTATAARASSSSGLQPCTSDSTPLPLPGSPDPVLLGQCQQFCNRNFTCVGCTFGTCMPNCMSDALATRPSGAPYVAWMNCLLAHDATCGAQPACDAEYCAYVRSNSSPSAPDPPECH
jgi:hypothetical protein